MISDRRSFVSLKKKGEENRLYSFLSSVTNYIWRALSLSFTPFSGNDVTEVVAGRMIQFIYTPFNGRKLLLRESNFLINSYFLAFLCIYIFLIKKIEIFFHTS